MECLLYAGRFLLLFKFERVSFAFISTEIITITIINIVERADNLVDKICDRLDSKRYRKINQMIEDLLPHAASFLQGFMMNSVSLQFDKYTK